MLYDLQQGFGRHVILALEKRLIAIRSLKRNLLEAETVSLAVAS